MTRSTSTQRGASRRSASPTAKSGSGKRGADARARASKPSRRTGSVARTSRTQSGTSNPWVPFACVGIVIALGWVLYPALRLDYQASRDRAVHEAELQQLSKGNEKLAQEIDALKTPKGVEKEARESLGYAKSGEHVYVVMQPGQETSGAADLDVTRADLAGRSVVQVILDALFGVKQPAAATVEP